MRYDPGDLRMRGWGTGQTTTQYQPVAAPKRGRSRARTGFRHIVFGVLAFVGTTVLGGLSEQSWWPSSIQVDFFWGLIVGFYLIMEGIYLVATPNRGKPLDLPNPDESAPPEN